MAKNITLMGANYPDVPAVQLPQTGGGTATFVDLNELNDIVYVTTVTIGDTVVGTGGYTNISSYKPTKTGYTLIQASVRGFDDISSKTSFNVTADGLYLIGTAGATVYRLRVRYVFVKDTYIESSSSF